MIMIMMRAEAPVGRACRRRPRPSPSRPCPLRLDGSERERDLGKRGSEAGVEVSDQRSALGSYQRASFVSRDRDRDGNSPSSSSLSSPFAAGAPSSLSPSSTFRTLLSRPSSASSSSSPRSPSPSSPLSSSSSTLSPLCRASSLARFLSLPRWSACADENVTLPALPTAVPLVVPPGEARREGSKSASGPSSRMTVALERERAYSIFWGGARRGGVGRGVRASGGGGDRSSGQL